MGMMMTLINRTSTAKWKSYAKQKKIELGWIQEGQQVRKCRGVGRNVTLDVPKERKNRTYYSMPKIFSSQKDKIKLENLKHLVTTY